jgi:hypothetical protein
MLICNSPLASSVIASLTRNPLIKCVIQGIPGQARNDYGLNVDALDSATLRRMMGSLCIVADKTGCSKLFHVATAVLYKFRLHSLLPLRYRLAYYF